MADIVKFKSGQLDNIATTTTPIVAGTVYFAIEDDNSYGSIYFDKDSTHRVKMSEHFAESAGSASQDSEGQSISGTYIKSISFDGTTNTAKVTAIFTRGDGSTFTADLPNAGASAAGVITAGAQTIAGNKTFTGAFSSSGGATFSNSNFDYSGMEAGTTNAARVVWFSDNSKRGKPVYDTDFTYNPSTNTLVVTNLIGTASKALADENGLSFIDHYLIDWSVSGSTITLTKGSGNTSTIPAPWLLLTGGQVTGPVTFGNSVTIDSLTAGSAVINGHLTVVNGITGNLTGNVTGNLTGTADYAKYADGDGSSTKIRDKYITTGTFTSDGSNVTFTPIKGSGGSGTGVNLPKATTSVYGVTKLVTATNSTASDLAATPKMIQDIIASLDGNLNSTTPGANKTVTVFSETDGKVSIKFEAIAIDSSQVKNGSTAIDNLYLSNWQTTDTTITLTKGSGSQTTIPAPWLPLTGGTITGPTIFGDSVTLDSFSTESGVVNGNLSVAGNIYGNLTGNVVGNVTGNLSGTATYAQKASGDTANIRDKYIYTAKFTSDGSNVKFTPTLGTGGDGTVVNLPKATTSVYGVTKLSSTASSSEQGLAATPKLVYDSIAALDGSITSSPSKSKTLTAFSQTDGKVSATFGDIEITPSQVKSGTSTIDDLYLKDWSINGKTVTLTKGSGSTSTVTMPSITIGASSVDLGGILTSIVGPLAVTTSADAEKAFKIQRSGTGEQVAVWVDDSYVHFDVTNDETTANVRFTLHATDTESGGGAGDQTSYVTFSGVSGKSTVTADYFTGLASRATYDDTGLKISDTYIPKSIGTAKGDIIYWTASGTPVRLAASTNGKVLKLVNGVPAWDNDIDVDIKVALTSTSTSGDYPLMFGPTTINSGSSYQAYYNSGIKVNPNTKTITATKFDGTATRAVYDDTNNTKIIDLYISNITVTDNDTKIQLTKGSGNSSKIAAPWLPLIGGAVTGAVTFGNSVSIDNLTAGSTVINGHLTVVNGITGNLTGNVIGNLSGNATSATYADGDGTTTSIRNKYWAGGAFSQSSSKVQFTPKAGSGSNLTAIDFPNASTSNYGATKLSSTASSSEQGLAATPKLVYDSIAALDGVISGSPSKSKTLSAFSETDGKVSATFVDIEITPSQVKSGTSSIDDIYLKNWQTTATTITLTKGSGATSTISAPWLPLIGGTVTGPIIFGDLVTLDSFNAESGIINGNLSVAGMIYGNVTGDLTGNATTATSATNDDTGLRISDTYISKAIGTTKGDIIYWSGNKTPVRLAAGSNGQVLKIANGVPTWGSDVDYDVKVKLTSKADNVNYPIIFGPSSASSGTAYDAYYNSSIHINPSTGTITATKFEGEATSTINDSNSQKIIDTYIKNITVSGTTFTLTKGNGSTSTISIPQWTLTTRFSKTEDNTKIEDVTGWITGNKGFIHIQGFADPSVYRTSHDMPAPYGIGFGNGSESAGIMPVGAGDKLQELRFYGANSGPTIFTFGRQTWESTSYDSACSNRYVTYASINSTNGNIITSGTITATGNITAPRFIGLADKATADGDNRNIADTYIFSISGSDANHKITYTKGSGGTTDVSLPYMRLAGDTVTGASTFQSTLTVIRNIFTNTTSVPENGETVLTALGFKTGYPVYTDPLFESGTNSVGLYNNSNSSAPYTSVTRMTYTDAGITSPGTGSNYVIRIQNTGSGTSPGLGGFVQSITSRANAVFIQIFRALVPVGYTLYTASNSMGTSYSDTWLTDPKGTGKWEWYARRVLCGKEGSFSSGGHVYLSGTAGTTSAPVNWYLSYCNLYDLTKAQYDGLRTRYADEATIATKDSTGLVISDNYALKTGTNATGTWPISISGNAATATNADKVDNYHAADLWRKDGGVWNPGANITLGATANNQEWSFDISRNGYTGTYWHVWDSARSVMLKVTPDDGKVSAPYGFVGNLEGNASTATKLATPRYINDTDFDGSASITTVKWGTARDITIGATTKSVNGSTNYIWTINEINRKNLGYHNDYERVVIGLCQLTGTNTGICSNWHGKIYRVRSNGLTPDYVCDIDISASYGVAQGFFYNFISNYENLDTNAITGNGYRACVFKYNDIYYGGVEFYQVQASTFYINGVGDFTPFLVKYYNHNTSTVLNTEINDSLTYSTSQCIRQNNYFTGYFTGSLSGNATSADYAKWADGDSSSANRGKIREKYVSALNISNTQIKLVKGDGDESVVYTAPWLPLAGGQVTGATTFGSAVSIDALTAGSAVVNGHLTVINGITGNLIGNVVGNLSGNATTADTAKYADGDGTTKIRDKYLSDVAYDSTNFKLTKTKGDGSKTDIATIAAILGFASRQSSASWGNTTGTTVLSLNDSDGGSLDFRKNNPSSGKLSLKVDGRFYFNEGATPAAGLKSANSYWGMTGPDGEDNIWIRTTSQGIIPYQSGGSGSGHGYLGTDTWYFAHAYIDQVHGALKGTADYASKAAGDSGTIRDTYISNITTTPVSHKLTFTKGSGGTTDKELPFALLTGDTFTGPVIFGDSVTIDSFTAEAGVINGNLSVAGTIYGNITGNLNGIAQYARYADGDNGNLTIQDKYVAELTADNDNHQFHSYNGAGGLLDTVSLPYLLQSGDTLSGNLDIEYDNEIIFYGANNNTSPRTVMGYYNTMGGVMHCQNTYQTSGAFYISSNGCDGANDNGGIAIDNEGVTVFGAGDAGTNFTGVFRVINEDDVANGPIFLIKKTGEVLLGQGNGYNISADGSHYSGTAAQATSDADGRNIADTYIATITADNANHQFKFTKGSGAETTIALPYVLKSGDTMTGELINQSGGIWVQGGSSAGSDTGRMGLINGMPTNLAYNTSKRGVRIYSNAIAFADPYNGNSNNDSGWIRHIEESGNNGILEIGVGDDGNESIIARQYNTSSTIVKEAYLLNANGNTSFPGNLGIGITSPEYKLHVNGSAVINNSFIANANTTHIFATDANTFYINKALNWNASSYYEWVYLLIPVLTSTNQSAMNYIEGTFNFWKTGGNVYDNVEINLNCVYNCLEYALQNYGQGNDWKLVTCTYNGIKYYALKGYYHANPYTHVTFNGHVRSDLAGGNNTTSSPLNLPYAVAYYNYTSNSANAVVLNNEIYNSLSTTLTDTNVTSVNRRGLSNDGGFIGNLTGWSSNNIKVQTSAPTGDARTLWVDTSAGADLAVLKYWTGSAWKTIKSVWA